jgi:hypothetical protein
VTDRPLASPAHDVADALAANELFQERGWTDGLPIVPPTEEALGTSRRPSDGFSVESAALWPCGPKLTEATQPG